MMHVTSQIEYRETGTGHIVAGYVVVEIVGDCRRALVLYKL